MDLKKVGIREVEVPFCGEVLKLKHKRIPLKIALSAMNDEQGGTQTVVDWLAESIVEWNLFDGETPLPPTKEVLESLPLALVLEIAKVVQNEFMEEQVPLLTSNS